MMKKMKISTAALVLLMSIGTAPLTASAPLSVSAAGVTTTYVKPNSIKAQTMNVEMVFDGVSLSPSSAQTIFAYKNTIYVPVRFVSNALQKTVSWDAKNLKVTVAEPSSSELMVIKEYLMNAVNNKATVTVSKTVTLSSVNANFIFNGLSKSLPAGQSSYTLNGTLYVPLRFLSESVGNEITWNQKAKKITAVSIAYQEQVNSGNIGQETSTKPSPTATTGSSQNGTGGTGATGKVSYEEITSATEAKLNALKAQSQSTLMSIAFEYLAASDEGSKASIKAKGLAELSSFTASFNSIVADAEQKLKANGHSTDIISQYRSEFESQLQIGRDLAEGMAG